MSLSYRMQLVKAGLQNPSVRQTVLLFAALDAIAMVAAVATLVSRAWVGLGVVVAIYAIGFLAIRELVRRGRIGVNVYSNSNSTDDSDTDELEPEESDEEPFEEENE